MRAQTLLLFAIGAFLALGMAALRLADPAPVRDLRLAGFDMLQRLSPRAYEPVPVRIVDIDEASLAAIGQWPWPRDVLADLSNRLAAAGAAVVVHDILYAEPDRLSPRHSPGAAGPSLLPDTDAILAEALARVPSVLGTARITAGNASAAPAPAGFVLVGADPLDGLPVATGLTPILPALAEAASGVGVISVGPDGGGPIRRLPLAWSTPDGPRATLSVEALRLGLGAPSVTLYGFNDPAGVVDGIGLGDLFVPTTGSGEMWLRYRAEVPEVYIPALAVLTTAPEDWAPLVEGHIVLIGTSAAGLLDLRRTALGETVPGVSIHAQAIEQMFLGDHLSRSDVTGGLEVLTVLGLVAAITIAVAAFGPIVAMGLGGLGAVGVLSASWLSFTRAGVLFDASFPLLAGGLAFALLTAYRLVVVDRERRLIRRSFAHYVAPDVIEDIEKSGHSLALGGEARDVTVMFTDLRGFTEISERLPAEETVTLLNSLFDAFGEEIMAERGTIDKFIGDAVMAFWNAPLPLADHPARAVAAALRIRAALGRFNATRPHYAPLRLAIGIATGPASVGNIGSRNRFNYSVVGPAVNLASRVEGACRPVGADLLITDDVARATEGLALLDAGRLAFKGVRQRVQCHLVVGGEGFAEDARFARLAALHTDLAKSLARGEVPADRIAEARDLADSLHPLLTDFYDALPSRLSDYRP